MASPAAYSTRGTNNNDAELIKDIYYASSKEGWSKDKLFSVLADPLKYKKSTRYLLNKVIAIFKYMSSIEN